MKHTGRLKIILQQIDKNKKILRMFDRSSFPNSKFGKRLKELLKTRTKEIKEAFPEGSIMSTLIDKVPRKDFALYTEPQPMPWYLDVIAQTIINERGAYKIHYKACRDYSYFVVNKPKPRSKNGNLVLPPFFHEAPEKIESGNADALLFLSPYLSDIIEGRAGSDDKPRRHWVREAIDWFRLELNIRSVRHSGTRYELDVQATVDWDDSPVKEDQKSITILKPDGKSDGVIVSSKNVREAIASLSEAWHNPSARSIVLCAGTGSGKEVLRDVLTYALSLRNVKTIPLAAPELTTGQIFTELNKTEFLNTKPVKKEWGLRNGPLLFIDEIHHPSAQGLREQLLRVLEEKKITAAISKSKLKTINCEKLRYLFAASELPEKLRTHYPPDFWTRIEYNVVMHHPLGLETRDEINETLQQFFCKFWRKVARDQRTIADQSKGKWPGANTAAEQIGDIVEDLSGREAVKILADAFADALDSPLIPLISIRHLRSIVNRLFSRAIYHVRTTKLERADTAQEVKSQLDKWIIDIFKEIVPEIKPDGLF
jgi:Sigma-54 interaction domain